MRNFERLGAAHAHQSTRSAFGHLPCCCDKLKISQPFAASYCPTGKARDWGTVFGPQNDQSIKTTPPVASGGSDPTYNRPAPPPSLLQLQPSKVSKNLISDLFEAKILFQLKIHFLNLNTLEQNVTRSYHFPHLYYLTRNATQPRPSPTSCSQQQHQ